MSAPSDKTLEREIRKALRARKGEATLADVVVDTGIATIEAERMLRRMIGDYPCHLDVTEEGDLLYHFEPAMRRHDDRHRLRRWASRVGPPVWAGFSKCMKALIAVVMVVYVVLFVVLIVGAMVAASRGGQDSRRRFPGPQRGRGSGGMFWFWFWVFGRPGDPWRTHRRRNPAYGRFRSSSSRKKGDDRPFYLKVFSFVLGPDRGDVEPVVDDAALLAYVREKAGAVTTAEVASRTGWPLARAEEMLTGMVARYDGNLVVTDDGHLVFTFTDLLKSSESREKKPAPAFWDRWEQPMPVTGNSTASNVLIGCLNGFNLIAALAAPSAILPALGWAATPGLLLAVSWFPAGFAGLVFALPLLRIAFWVAPENARRRGRNVRRAVFQTVFETARRSDDAAADPEELAERALGQLPGKEAEGDATLEKMRQATSETLHSLAGELDLDEETGLLTHRYDELRGLLNAARDVRRALKADSADEVRVVFSTAEPDTVAH